MNSRVICEGLGEDTSVLNSVSYLIVHLLFQTNFKFPGKEKMFLGVRLV